MIARGRRRGRLALGMAAAAVCVLAVAGVAQAAEPSKSKAPSLLTELGVQAGERLLASDQSRERQRGLARLSALGTPRAIELLARALDPGGAARGAGEHLVAVRALAPHARSPLAREALVRAMSSPPAEADAGPLSDWVRGASALALAQTQEPLALAALARALGKPGRAAELAKDALLANPPLDLAPLLHLPGAPSKELCEALGALGDRRAEGFLRAVVRRAPPETRAAAALALLRLGSTEVLELARHWLRSERQPLLVTAATRILTQAGAADAAAPLAQMAGALATRPLALELLLETDGRVPAPSELTPAYAGDRSGSLLEVFARGGAWGRPRIEQALQSPDSAGLAVYALSRAPGPAAQERLERALSEPRLRSLALRALALRYARLGDDTRAARKLLPGLLASRDATERAAAAFAAALFTPDRLPELLGSRDLVVVRAAARAAMRGAPARLAAVRLSRESDVSLRAALSIALADRSAAELVPTPLLLELVHDAGPASLLAVAALAARKDAELAPLLRELLTSGDPWLRAHVLLGLGRARDADALGMIENAYRFESEPLVRHAAVVALSQRPEAVRLRGLSLAAELDGDLRVREAARVARLGHPLGEGGLGTETAWLELSRSPGLEPGAQLAAQLRFGAGPALPALADPDGVVALAGVDPAPLAVRLALFGDRVDVRGVGP